MSGGIFFFVVGPSGVGKDSLIDGARAMLAGSAQYVFAQRVITRPAGAPGEDHRAMTEADFMRAAEAGDFLVTWGAHGLHYGLPTALLEVLANGGNVIANGSRTMIRILAQRVPRLVVIEVTAPIELLASRIASRGRESGDEIKKRLLRQVAPLPVDIETYQVINDGTLAQGVERFMQLLNKASQQMRLRRLPIQSGRDLIGYLPATSSALAAGDYLMDGKVEVSGAQQSVSVKMHTIDAPALLRADEIGLSQESFAALGLSEGSAVSIRRTPSPASRQALMDKIRGVALNEEQYGMLFRDIIGGRYAESEIAAFLVTATKSLTDDEVLALAKVRSTFAKQIEWDEPIVVDKHSMGGIPGSRITLIVVPIVAAFGIAMPKTSSRAITSAAGTADAMETVARVDLDAADVQRCVKQARACIAWNGRLNHSVVDDVMNAITRPLGIDSNRWSVASILSKKKTAGSTHVIVDLPYGKRTKLKTREDAQQLADLFELTGAGLGLQVKAFATAGDRPVGRGIGPALEVRDVEWVLREDPKAPADLREKALFFASRILAWHPAIGSVEKGRSVAIDLLASGAAYQAFQNIIDAQGRKTAILPGALTHQITAQQAGKVSEIDGWAIAGIARRAGAPNDRSAGIDLLCQVGDEIRVGQGLYVIHASNSNDLEAAVKLAELDCGFVV